LSYLEVAMVERLRGRAAVEQRARRLAAEPLCRKCKAKGIVRASTVPDHIIALVNASAAGITTQRRGKIWAIKPGKRSVTTVGRLSLYRE
jgi:hypothetical protein